MHGKKMNLCLLGVNSINQGRAISSDRWLNWYAFISKGSQGGEPRTTVYKFIYFASKIAKCLIYQLLLI
jgi:hypothetical protein